ncbi:LuxR C-terminal-related transcriptional regulator [Streptomyces sp. NPDC101062]|uniref:helix-turn-helix transcriptional regulator n=2 Tax=unclassified Streptomyces TaxID=2593676 RepID=UPI0038116E73
MATAAIRRGDLLAAARHVETVHDAIPDSVSPDDLARYDWLILQFAAASIGARRAVEQFIAEQPERLSDGVMLSLEPEAAPWLVRVLLRADDRAAAESVVRAAGPETRPGSLHARSLLDRDTAGLRQVVERYRDPWARASAVEDLGMLLMAAPERPYVESEFRLRQAAEMYRKIGSVRDEERALRRVRKLSDRIAGLQAPDIPATDISSARSAPNSSWSRMTKSERAVANLARVGLSNHQIAGRLSISPHTVDFHLRRIFQKLGVRSRVQLANKLSSPMNRAPNAEGAC